MDVLNNKYIVPGALALFLAYSVYTTTLIDVVYYIAFILLGIHLGQEYYQIPNLKNVVIQNQKIITLQ